MARKSKAKYKMKGHSISGIKGFKDTSLEDGRAASSAFQMKGSPLYEEKLGELDWKDEDYDVDPHKLPEHLKWKEQGDQEGLVWGLGEVGKAIRRKQWNKKNEEKKENETEGDKLDDQTTKYDGPVEGSNMDKDLSSKSTGDGNPAFATIGTTVVKLSALPSLSIIIVSLSSINNTSSLVR